MRTRYLPNISLVRYRYVNLFYTLYCTIFPRLPHELHKQHNFPSSPPRITQAVSILALYRHRIRHLLRLPKSDLCCCGNFQSFYDNRLVLNLVTVYLLLVRPESSCRCRRRLLIHKQNGAEIGSKPLLCRRQKRDVFTSV